MQIFCKLPGGKSEEWYEYHKNNEKIICFRDFDVSEQAAFEEESDEVFLREDSESSNANGRQIADDFC